MQPGSRFSGQAEHQLRVLRSHMHSRSGIMALRCVMLVVTTAALLSITSCPLWQSGTRQQVAHGSAARSYVQLSSLGRLSQGDSSSSRRKSLVLGLGACAVAGPFPAVASDRSRTTGYEVQRKEKEWIATLSPGEYFVLRQGGTETPGTSVLLDEKRTGVFKCAGCGSSLFSSADKFNSGTGWPSFAEKLPGVEEEEVNPVARALLGAELRCARCGGHLGDVFSDGKLFLGTRAFETGKRYCIDGAALVFYPEDGSVAVRGEGPPSAPFEFPDWLSSPSIGKDA